MPFDIEKYLDTLPLDTNIINLSDKNLAYIPSLLKFKCLVTFICSNNYLIKLPEIGDKLVYLDCSNNLLTELPFFKNIQQLVCSNNKVKYLPNYEIIEYLDISFNFLTNIDINNLLVFLNCSHNLLSDLPNLSCNLTHLYCNNNLLSCLPLLNDKLKYLRCDHNQITRLPRLNDNLLNLICSNNKLTWFPNLNNKLKQFVCFNNIAYEIITTYHVGNKKNNIRKINNFRYTYYALKFKNQFKKWLWEKVREPKIMKQFHPDHLNTLEETDDLEVFLENWIKN
jgi:hypothetical protein